MGFSIYIIRKIIARFNQLIIYLSQLIIFQLEKLVYQWSSCPGLARWPLVAKHHAPVWPVQAPQPGPRNADASWVSGSRSSSPGRSSNKKHQRRADFCSKNRNFKLQNGGLKSKNLSDWVEKTCRRNNFERTKIIQSLANKWSDCILSCKKKERNGFWAKWVNSCHKSLKFCYVSPTKKGFAWAPKLGFQWIHSTKLWLKKSQKVEFNRGKMGSQERKLGYFICKSGDVPLKLEAFTKTSWNLTKLQISEPWEPFRTSLVEGKI
jgi:hypothetical protein